MRGDGSSWVESGHSPFLETPSDFTLIQAASGAGQVTLSWTESNKATSYKIEYGTTSGVYSSTASSCTANSTVCIIPALTNGITYYFKVTAANSIGSKVANNELPATPIGSFSLSGAIPAASQITLAYSLAAGATNYIIRYGFSSGNYLFTFSTSETASPVIVTGLNNGTTYYFQVTAINSSGFVNATNELFATPIGLPTVPGSLSATSTPGTINLTWTGSTGGGIGYTIKRATSAGGPYTDLATGITDTHFIDNSITTAQVYYYAVAAINGGGSSANSNEISILSVQSFTISNFSVSTSSATINWPSVPGAANYTVKQSNLVGQSNHGSSVIGCINISSTTCTASGLTPNIPYYFMVIAQNSGAGSVSTSESNEIAATPLVTPFTATIAGTNQVQFQWNSIGSATGYSIKYSSNSGQAASTGTTLPSCSALGAGATGCTGTGLSNGVQYYFSIEATLSGGGTYQSSEVSGTPIASFTMDPATILSADSVQISWSTATGASNYNVTYGTTSGGPWASSGCSTTASNCIVNGLSSNTTYYFMVTATNGSGSIAASGANISATIPLAAAIPIGLTASAATPGQINLSWSASASGTSPIKYSVYRSTTSGSGYSAISNCTLLSTLTCSDSTTSPGQQYYYVVAATNPGGTSSYSNQVTQISMSAFSITSATSGVNKVIIVWESSTGANTYIVQYGTASGTWSTVFSTSAVSGIEVTGLTSGTPYFFMVKAVNSVGGDPAGMILAQSEVTAIPLSLFSSSLDYSTSLTYTGSTSALEVTGGVARLVAADLTDDATSAVGGDLDFSNYISRDSNINVASKKLLLTNSGTNSNWITYAELDSTWAPQYSNLAGYWKLDGSLGTAPTDAVVPASKGSVNGVIHGTALTVSYTSGKFDQGLYFAATNTRQVDIGDGSQFNYGTSSFTVSYWIKYDAGTSNPMWSIGKGYAYSGAPCAAVTGAGTGGWGISHWSTVDPVSLDPYFSDGSICLHGGSGTSRIRRGQWAHVVLRADRTTNYASLFVNGIRTEYFSIASLGSISNTTQPFTIGKGAGTIGGNFTVDDAAIWSTALSDTEIASITSRQSPTFGGLLTSRVIDGLNPSVDWSKLNFASSLPFGKEVASSTETNYNTTVSDFSSGLIGHWGLNEPSGSTTIVDSSPSGYNGALTGSYTLAAPGILSKAIVLNSGATVNIGDHYDFTGLVPHTISVWFKTTISSGFDNILNKRTGGAGTWQGWVMYVIGANGQVCFERTNNLQPSVCSTTLVNNGQWHLATYTYDGSNMKLYVDGVLNSTLANSVNLTDTIKSFEIISTFANSMRDEVAIWSRALSTLEVAELYRRGVNRNRFQVRTCDDAACSNNSPAWTGIEGQNANGQSAQSTFGEVQNTATGADTSTISANPFAVLWTALKSTYYGFSIWMDAIPFGSVANKRKQFIQYRAILESDDLPGSILCTSTNSISLNGSNAPNGDRPCMPDITSVSFGPARYSTNDVYAHNFGSAGIAYYKIYDAVVTGESCASGIRYDFADGGASLSTSSVPSLSWKTFRNGTWVNSNGYAGGANLALTASELDSLSQAAFESFPRSAGYLYIRAHLKSSGTSPCQIDNIAISGER
jgi:hypothetical protein